MTRRLITWALRIYPSAWRDRYGAEFAATIEDMPEPKLDAVWDVCKGALAIRIQQGSNKTRTVAIFGVLGLLIAGGISLRIQDQYLSQSVLQSASLDNETLDKSIRRLLTPPYLKNLVEKHGLYAAERCCLPMEDFMEKTRKSISLTVPSGQRNAKRAFVVGFKYFDAAIAQKVTSDLTNVLMLENAAASITILDSASLPAPFFPNRRNIAFAGLLGGAILGASWAFLKGRKTPSGSGTPAAAPQ